LFTLHVVPDRVIGWVDKEEACVAEKAQVAAAAIGYARASLSAKRVQAPLPDKKKCIRTRFSVLVEEKQNEKKEKRLTSFEVFSE
jgi:hypothetical protein